MGMATSKVRLNICGSSYVVNTSESEDYMKNLADRLNLDMNELMASSNSVSITTAAVMTALNYRDELEKASGSADNMRRQIKDYLEDAASAKMAAEEARRENASLKRRVDELERRLIGRGTEDMEKVRSRLNRGKVEFAAAKEFDYFVINDTVDRAVDDILAIMRAEHCRPDERIDKINQ